MVEMGGASTQIANFENNGDLMVRNIIVDYSIGCLIDI